MEFLAAPLGILSPVSAIAMRAYSPTSASANTLPRVVYSSPEPPPSTVQSRVISDQQQQNAIYENRAVLKVLTSRIAMHLSEVQRRDLFKQLDRLLSSEHWSVEDDRLIEKESFRTFLRFLVYFGAIRRPALTVFSTGNIAASWISADRRLTIEFRKNDQIQLVLFQRGTDEANPEINVYTGELKRIDHVLAPFGAVDWYKHGST